MKIMFILFIILFCLRCFAINVLFKQPPLFDYIFNSSSVLEYDQLREIIVHRARNERLTSAHAVVVVDGLGDDEEYEVGVRLRPSQGDDVSALIVQQLICDCDVPDGLDLPSKKVVWPDVRQSVRLPTLLLPNNAPAYFNDLFHTTFINGGWKVQKELYDSTGGALDARGAFNRKSTRAVAGRIGGPSLHFIVDRCAAAGSLELRVKAFDWFHGAHKPYKSYDSMVFQFFMNGRVDAFNQIALFIRNADDTLIAYYQTSSSARNLRTSIALEEVVRLTNVTNDQWFLLKLEWGANDGGGMYLALSLDNVEVRRVAFVDALAMPEPADSSALPLLVIGSRYDSRMAMARALIDDSVMINGQRVPFATASNYTLGASFFYPSFPSPPNNYTAYSYVNRVNDTVEIWLSIGATAGAQSEHVVEVDFCSPTTKQVVHRFNFTLRIITDPFDLVLDTFYYGIDSPTRIDYWTVEEGGGVDAYQEAQRRRGATYVNAPLTVENSDVFTRHGFEIGVTKAWIFDSNNRSRALEQRDALRRQFSQLYAKAQDEPYNEERMFLFVNDVLFMNSLNISVASNIRFDAAMALATANASVFASAAADYPSSIPVDPLRLEFCLFSNNLQAPIDRHKSYVKAMYEYFFSRRQRAPLACIVEGIYAQGGSVAPRYLRLAAGFFLQASGLQAFGVHRVTDVMFDDDYDSAWLPELNRPRGLYTNEAHPNRPNCRPFFFYPSATGPMLSLRTEAFAAGVVDAAYVETLRRRLMTSPNVSIETQLHSLLAHNVIRTPCTIEGIAPGAGGLMDDTREQVRALILSLLSDEEDEASALTATASTSIIASTSTSTLHTTVKLTKSPVSLHNLVFLMISFGLLVALLLVAAVCCLCRCYARRQRQRLRSRSNSINHSHRSRRYSVSSTSSSRRYANSRDGAASLRRPRAPTDSIANSSFYVKHPLY